MRSRPILSVLVVISLAASCDRPPPEPAPTPSLPVEPAPAAPPPDLSTVAETVDLATPQPLMLVDGAYRSIRVRLPTLDCFTWTENSLSGTYEVKNLIPQNAVTITKVGSSSPLCNASLASDGRFQQIFFLQDANCAWMEEMVCTAEVYRSDLFVLDIKRTLSNVTSLPGKTCNRTITRCGVHYYVDLIHS